MSRGEEGMEGVEGEVNGWSDRAERAEGPGEGAGERWWNWG